MIDKWGREIDYLRISLTDRCNLRCVYCMPEDGIKQLPREEILSFDEIVKLCTIMAQLGIRKIKLTGGEPLVRKNCAGLLRRLKEISGIETVTLTTNGILLKDQMEDLAEAGLDAVNISLDTLDYGHFFDITRKDQLQDVLAGINKALQYPKITVKINCVPFACSDQEIIGMAGLAKRFPLHVRFIEMMPLGCGQRFSCREETAILDILKQEYGEACPYNERLGNGPGHYYSFEGFCGKVGFISALSHKFCDSCNRIRLTAEGRLKVCLQYQIGTDLKTPLRGGSSEEELKIQILNLLKQKPSGHHFFEEKTAADEERMMSQIGG